MRRVLGRFLVGLLAAGAVALAWPRHRAVGGAEGAGRSAAAPWDHGWARLYETHPYFPFDGPRVEQIAERVCRIIRVVQPMLVNVLAKLPPIPEAVDRRQQWHRTKR